MSKLYEHYQFCKEKYLEKIILIKSGNFYVILDDDAKNVNEKLGLKLVDLNEKIVKCGFPINSLPKYEKMLKANSIDYFITELNTFNDDFSKVEKSIIKDIKKLDIDNLTPILAINTLIKYKEKLIKFGEENEC